MEALVTVAVPAYNHSKFINDCLDSLIKQTYKNIELIIIDDCSNDDTYDLIVQRKDELTERFINLVILKNNKNLGISRTVNKLISLANGEYIKTIASDDMLLPNCVEMFVKFSKQYKADFYYSDEYFVPIDSNYNELVSGNHLNYKKSQSLIFDNYFKALLEHGMIILAPTTFFTKELFNNVGGFDENIIVEDYPFYLKVAKKYKIEFLPKPTVYYRLVNTEHKTDRRLIDLIRCYNYVIMTYFDDMSMLAKKKLVYRIIDYYYSIKQKSNIDDIIKIISNLKKLTNFTFFDYYFFRLYYTYFQKIISHFNTLLKRILCHI